MNTQQNPKKHPAISPGPLNHPSGLENEAEVTYVSLEFWSTVFPELPEGMATTEIFDRMLAYQQGWKACKDFYKINT